MISISPPTDVIDVEYEISNIEHRLGLDTRQHLGQHLLIVFCE